MPGIVGTIRIVSVSSGSIVHIGDAVHLSPTSTSKTFAGAGSFNTGDHIRTFNSMNATNTWECAGDGKGSKDGKEPKDGDHPDVAGKGAKGNSAVSGVEPNAAPHGTPPKASPDPVKGSMPGIVANASPNAPPFVIPSPRHSPDKEDDPLGMDRTSTHYDS